MTEPTKYLLDEDAIPSHWYNIQADLPSPAPPVLHPGTLQPVGPDDLAPLFPMALIGQEVSQEREIEIPLPVREAYRAWRPTPLYRARRLEKMLRGRRAHLLQVRGREPHGEPQAQHRGRPGVLQPGGRRRAPRDGDRSRPVGIVARLCRRALRARGEGVHGAGELRSEAVPQGDDGPVSCRKFLLENAFSPIFEWFAALRAV